MSYAIFLDFDGTLKARNADKMSQRVVDTLKNAQKKGHKVFLNTGRAPSFLDFEAFNSFCFDGFLCGCSYIKVGEEILMADRLSADEIKPIVSYFYGKDVVVLLEGEKTMWAAFDKEGKTLRDGMVPINDIDEILHICQREPITKMNVLKALDREELDFVRNFTDPIERDDALCTELVSKGHDKAYVMNKTVEYLGMDPKKVIAMGDSSNDFSMLASAEISVAMGNATEGAKKLAKYITATDDEDGVAVFLEDFLK